MTTEELDDFIEEPFEVLDPDDHFILQQLASGRAGYFADDRDRQTSRRHRIGYFWLVEARSGRPDLISFLIPFADAPRGSTGAFELPLDSVEFGRAWAAMEGPGQHLTPHHRKCWEGVAATDWPRGSVRYDPAEDLWTIHTAGSIAADGNAIEEVRQRFVMDGRRTRLEVHDEFEAERG